MINDDVDDNNDIDSYSNNMILLLLALILLLSLIVMIIMTIILCTGENDVTYEVANQHLAEVVVGCCMMGRLDWLARVVGGNIYATR